MNNSSLQPTFFKIFDTQLGRCGIAWDEKTVVSFQLPDISDGKLVMGIKHRAGNCLEAEAPQWITNIIERVQKHFSGESLDDFLDVALNFEGMPQFFCAVYDEVRKVLPGQIKTYGEIAAAVGMPQSAQGVGMAMGKNPFPLFVPCHRIVSAQNKMGGFSAYGGVDTKLKMLKLEGALLTG